MRSCGWATRSPCSSRHRVRRMDAFRSGAERCWRTNKFRATSCRSSRVCRRASAWPRAARSSWSGTEMIRRLVEIALRNRVMIAALVAILFLGGLAGYRRLAIEAYPNPVPPLVEVISQPPGWSAEETERYVTIPLEIGLAGASGLDHVRSQSLFGLSDVKCYFKWGTDYWAARQEVINRLQFIQLPAGSPRSSRPGTRPARSSATCCAAK